MHDLLRMMPIYYCATRTVFAHEWFVNCVVAFRHHGAEGGGGDRCFRGHYVPPILLVDDRSVSGFPSSFMEHDDALLVANYHKFQKDMLNKMAFCCFPLFLHKYFDISSFLGPFILDKKKTWSRKGSRLYLVVKVS